MDASNEPSTKRARNSINVNSAGIEAEEIPETAMPLLPATVANAVNTKVRRA
jgi:hypothetical protein